METKSQTKHTPGPWEVNWKEWQIMAREGNLSIAKVHVLELMDKEGIDSRHLGNIAKANARLIAAAPEMDV